jgi:hypothetical protein
MSEQLFVYGILLDKALRLRSFGRDVNSKPSVLEGYRMSDFNQTLPYKCVYQAKNNYVNGLNLIISHEELTHITDKIERVNDLGLYKRVIGKTNNGLSWVYVKGDKYD